jgi:hypothetical protein
MKGYLERLAASASRPQSRLRPVVGSIFAEGLREEKEEVALPVISERAAEGKKAQTTPQAERSRPTQEPRAINAEDYSRKPRPIDEKPAAFSPLLPLKIAEVDPAALHIGEASTEISVQPHLQSQAGARIEQHEHRLVTPMQERRDISEPLMLPPRAFEERNDERSAEADGQPVEVRTWAVEQLAKPITRSARADSREMTSALRAPERSETEEIQIHIGRIEVIAVPPPSARSAATPTSRFTSLDDYLKRRDGRAR